MAEGSTHRRRLSHATMLRLQRIVLVLAVLALVATVLGTVLAANAAGSEAKKELDAQGDAVVTAVVETFRAANSRLASLDALLEADRRITPPEFENFVRKIGLAPGMIGLGVVERVADSELSNWLQTHPGLRPVEIHDGERQPLTARPVHYLAVLGAPGAEMRPYIGADLGAYPEVVDAMNRVIGDGSPVPTTSVSFGEPEPRGILLIMPSEDAEGPVGVMAWIDLNTMFGARLHDGLADLVDWSVTDVTALADRSAPDWADWSSTVALNGRFWRIDVVSNTIDGPWPAERLLGGVAGLLVALMLGMLSFMLGRSAATRLEIDRMELLSEQKDRLLASVSHELRTPLTAVLGFMEELVERWDELPQGERRALLSVARDEAAEMSSLVEDLLVAARISGAAAPLPISREPVDLVARTAEIVGRLGKTSLVTFEGPDSVMAYADPLRVGQVVRNLIDNASRHGEPPITVTFHRDGTLAYIEVADTGHGVPVCCREAVFVSGLSRDHDHPGPNSGSNGLGLAASRYLARRMGGDLELKPDGHTFVLFLPAAMSGHLAAFADEQTAAVG